MNERKNNIKTRVVKYNLDKLSDYELSYLLIGLNIAKFLPTSNFVSKNKSLTKEWFSEYIKTHNLKEMLYNYGYYIAHNPDENITKKLRNLVMENCELYCKKILHKSNLFEKNIYFAVVRKPFPANISTLVENSVRNKCCKENENCLLR